ncbi:MAG: hypothetical protein ABIK77_03185 [candidate division WOR-3 bacterium]|uniref:Uncharacterized protein n=1 Tax=candidate division WOR-3 bacterium TaxID=2052148 RepID=A0A7V4CH67_UNCW3
MAFVLGILSVVIALLSIFLAIYLSKRTDKLIHTEDMRAKLIIEEGNRRLEEIMKKNARDDE